MRGNKDLSSIVKRVHDYKTKVNKLYNPDQFLYKANKSNNEIFKHIGRHEESSIGSNSNKVIYNSLLEFFDNNRYLKSNMKKIVYGLAIVIIGSIGYGFYNHSFPLLGTYSVQKYLQSYEDINPNDEDKDSKLDILLNSDGNVYSVSTEENAIKATSTFKDGDDENTILLITINKVSDNPNYADSKDVEQRKVGILMNKNKDGNITFKMTETKPSLPVLFNYKQQSISISQYDYKTILRASDGADGSKPLIKAALYCANKLNLIDLNTAKFNDI